MRILALIAFGLAAGAFATPTSAYTQEEQLACQDDAFRVCGHAVPDEQRVKACMMANVKRLSPGCRRMFQRGRRR
jgi:hypothetical protein